MTAAETADGRGTKLTKITKTTKDSFVIFVDFVAAAVARLGDMRWKVHRSSETRSRRFDS